MFQVIVCKRDGKPAERIVFETERQARRAAAEEAKWESCRRVYVPELDLIIDGDFAFLDNPSK